MKYYPIFLDLNGKKILVVGGGLTALQKIEGLLEAKGEITLISPFFCDPILQMGEEGVVELIHRKYLSGDLKGYFIVFGATNSREVNHAMHEEANQEKILFNAVDQPDECDFIIPSRVRRGDLTLAISTSGSAPFFAKILRQRFDQQLPEEYGELINLMGQMRHILLQEGRKSDLILFFQEKEIMLLDALQKRDFSRVEKIVEDFFGSEIKEQLRVRWNRS